VERSGFSRSVLKCGGIYGQGRGRQIGGGGAEGFVGRVAHLQFEAATIDEVGVLDPDAGLGLAIELDALEVFVVGGIVPADDGEGFAVVEADVDAIKNGLARS